MDVRIRYQACPLCNSPAMKEDRVGDCSKHALYKPAIPAAMRWKRCMICNHVFTEGYFTPEALAIVFDGTHGIQQLGADLERQRVISSRMIEKVLPYIDGGAWLDIGFGNGSLLFTAQEYGFVPLGTDLREKNVEMMKALGVEAYCCDLPSLKLTAQCEVISLADVLEHMPFPKKGLEAAHRLLAKDGVLFISLPNAESMLWRVLDLNNQNPYWGEIEHYHNFTRTRLYALLREAGFEPLQYGISDRYRACMEVIAKKAG